LFKSYEKNVDDLFYSVSSVYNAKKHETRYHYSLLWHSTAKGALYIVHLIFQYI